MPKSKGRATVISGPDRAVSQRNGLQSHPVVEPAFGNSSLSATQILPSDPGQGTAVTVDMRSATNLSDSQKEQYESLNATPTSGTIPLSLHPPTISAHSSDGGTSHDTAHEQGAESAITLENVEKGDYEPQDDLRMQGPGSHRALPAFSSAPDQGIQSADGHHGQADSCINPALLEKSMAEPRKTKRKLGRLKTMQPSSSNHDLDGASLDAGLTKQMRRSKSEHYVSSAEISDLTPTATSPEGKKFDGSLKLSDQDGLPIQSRDTGWSDVRSDGLKETAENGGVDNSSRMEQAEQSQQDLEDELGFRDEDKRKLGANPKANIPISRPGSCGGETIPQDFENLHPIMDTSSPMKSELRSDDYIGLPKEQYQPRPSHSRRKYGSPLQALSFSPKKKKKIKRSKTTNALIKKAPKEESDDDIVEISDPTLLSKNGEAKKTSQNLAVINEQGPTEAVHDQLDHNGDVSMTAEDLDDEDDEPPKKRPRGRPKAADTKQAAKQRAAKKEIEAQAAQEDLGDEQREDSEEPVNLIETKEPAEEDTAGDQPDEQPEEAPAASAKRPGRNKKVADTIEQEALSADENESEQQPSKKAATIASKPEEPTAVPPPQPKKRGRPPKSTPKSQPPNETTTPDNDNDIRAKSIETSPVNPTTPASEEHLPPPKKTQPKKKRRASHIKQRCKHQSNPTAEGQTSTVP